MAKVYGKVVLIGIFFSFLSGTVFKSNAQCSGLDFTANTHRGCAPLIVKFRPNGFSSGSSFQWNLKGSNISGKDTITSAYTVPGTYKIQMTVTPMGSSSPCTTVTKDTFITVLPNPVPDMRVTPGFTVCSGSSPVLFGDSTSGSVKRQWIIEGYAFSTKKVSDTIVGRGTIPVTLSVINKFGCVGSITNNLTVRDSVPVDFCANINVTSPSSVIAIFRPYIGAYSSSRTITRYNWSFPGGTPSTATTYSLSTVVKVTYPDNVNKYDVTLQVVMADGCTYTRYRKGFISPFLTPAFSNICAGKGKAFTVTGDTSDKGRQQYNFAFPGADLVSPYPNPPAPTTGATVVYKTAGAYSATVKYQYGDGLGCQISVYYPNFVSIAGLAANFTSTSNHLCTLNDTVHFINTSDSSGSSQVKYTWYILDSGATLLKKLGTSIGQDTSFSPFNVGLSEWRVFGVVLVATNANGCKDSIIHYKYVTVASPKADFKLTSKCPEDSVLFINLRDSLNTYLWSFGDTKTSTLTNPKHLYLNNGSYNVGLKVTNTYGCSDSISQKLTISPCVWPGDANNDKTVDMKDFLSIGIAYGIKGHPRPSANSTWTGQPCPDWDSSFASGVNYKHADCNGDSVIDYTDTLAISANYGKSHQKSSALDQGSPSDPHLRIKYSNDTFFAADTLKAQIYLGDNANPVKSIYGLKFSVNANPIVFDADKAVLKINASFFGTPNNDMLGLKINNTSNNQIDIGLTRISHKNTSGFGNIATLYIPIKATLPGNYNKAALSISDNLQITYNEQKVPLYFTSDSVLIKQDKTGIQSIAHEIVTNLTISPNPFQTSTTLAYNLSKNAQVQITLFDITGRQISLIASENQLPGDHQLEINAEKYNLNPGIYLLKFMINGEFVSRYVVKF